jgi:predicted DNA-binding transcriptional regulator AlpA
MRTMATKTTPRAATTKGAVSPTDGALGESDSLNPKETARYLNVSTSWLAKRRQDGDGPPFVKFGRAVRYLRSSLQQWVKVHQRMSIGG